MRELVEEEEEEEEEEDEGEKEKVEDVSRARLRRLGLDFFSFLNTTNVCKSSRTTRSGLSLLMPMGAKRARSSFLRRDNFKVRSRS